MYVDYRREVEAILSLRPLLDEIILAKKHKSRRT